MFAFQKYPRKPRAVIWSLEFASFLVRRNSLVVALSFEFQFVAVLKCKVIVIMTNMSAKRRYLIIYMQ